MIYKKNKSHFFRITCVILLFLIAGCKQKPTLKTADTSSYKEFKEYNIKVNFSQSFIIKENKKGSAFSDINVTGIGFINNTQTLTFKNTKPLQDFLISDLNADGYEELYIITCSGKQKPKSEIIGIAITPHKTYKKIYIPEFDKSSNFTFDYLTSYQGHDSIFIENQTLLRTFPVENGKKEMYIRYYLSNSNQSYALNGQEISR